ncbi:hypothetical protein RclHR1_02590014 [Rhizophagus clarus]|uniref:Uncharacterized protein n=1 Tax=Rhizophagus clarus TaxID=94130 RepID=A0A2Z6RDH7_9GLOM|nr:hypothetical protein RclHR1_02590014 [Rhizophagus clarus]
MVRIRGSWRLREINFLPDIVLQSLTLSEWTFPKVRELYVLSDDPSSSIDVYPRFLCGFMDLRRERTWAEVTEDENAELKDTNAETPDLRMEQSSVAVDGQLQNDKETIPEVLPEVMVSTVDVTDSVVD